MRNNWRPWSPATASSGSRPSRSGQQAKVPIHRTGPGRPPVPGAGTGTWSPVRTLHPALPAVLATSVGRTALLAQLSARPRAVDRDYPRPRDPGSGRGARHQSSDPGPIDRAGPGGRARRLAPGTCAVRVGRAGPRHAAQPGEHAAAALPRRRRRGSFDAVVCALLARATHLGLTAGPPVHLMERAVSEGWIHVPHPASLRALSG